MRSRSNRIGTLAALAAAAALLVWGWTQRERFAPLDTGSPAPETRLARLGGGTGGLGDYRGRVVLLNFWATWCVPCRREMPALQRVHDRLSGAGFEVVGLSVDAPIGVLDAFANRGGDVAAYVAELGLGFDILLDPEGESLRRWGVTGLPTTFLIGRDGRIVRRVVGPAEWDDAEHVAMIRDALEE